MPETFLDPCSLCHLRLVSQRIFSKRSHAPTSRQWHEFADSKRRLTLNSPLHNPSSLRFATNEQILHDCRWEAFRASGPGGQKRNKTSSAIRLVHIPTSIAGIANESRSQADNRKSALRRLRHRIALELRDPIDADHFLPPKWFTELCPGGRLEVSRKSELYLPAMGLLLDVMAATGSSVSIAAKLLRLSTGNLVRFLQGDEKMMARVNEIRREKKLKPLGFN